MTQLTLSPSQRKGRKPVERSANYEPFAPGPVRPCRRCLTSVADCGEHCRECSIDLAAEFHIRLLLAAYGQVARADGDNDSQPFAA